MKSVVSTKSAALATAILLVAMAAPAWAEDFIPYPNAGTIAPTNIFTATGTTVDAYYYGSTASDEDQVELLDVTSGANTGFIFDNTGTSPGTGPVSLNVTPGDTLEFILKDISTGGTLYSSNPADSNDGVNHAYATAYSADNTQSDYVAGIPAGTFIGMEDEPNGSSDFNYNDDDFVFTNVGSVAATPEPISFLLMGTGLAAIGLIRRRRA